MSAEKRWRMICYDIRDPERWRNVYKIICGYAERVQYSVYRARLDSQAVEQLRWELSRVMSPDDALLIVDLCPSCATNVISRNHVEGWEEMPPGFRILGGRASDQPTLDVDHVERDVKRDRSEVQDFKDEPAE